MVSILLFDDECDRSQIFFMNIVFNYLHAFNASQSSHRAHQIGRKEIEIRAQRTAVACRRRTVHIGALDEETP